MQRDGCWPVTRTAFVKDCTCSVCVSSYLMQTCASIRIASPKQGVPHSTQCSGGHDSKGRDPGPGSRSQEPSSGSLSPGMQLSQEQ
ncbi:hypothetical protein MC885_016454 [Smutsia gigantea]|nr:hypothetical protein MC885_016454 [Smutsia gigantea]